MEIVKMVGETCFRLRDVKEGEIRKVTQCRLYLDIISLVLISCDCFPSKTEYLCWLLKLGRYPVK